MNTGEDLSEFFKCLIQELRSIIDNKMDMILEKMNKQQEENILLHQKVRKLTEEMQKHTDEITELKRQTQSKSYSSAVTNPNRPGLH